MRAILTIFPRDVPHHAPHHLEAKNSSTAATDSSRPPRTESAVPIVSANTGAPPTLESILLQRLLSELETRNLEQIQAPYAREHQPRTGISGWARFQLALLWVMSIVLCVFIVKYLDRYKTPLSADPAQARSITNLTAAIGDQNRQFSRVMDSVEALANAVAASAERTNAMRAVLARVGRDLNQRELNQLDLRPKPPAAPLLAPVQHDAPISMGGHHHPPAEHVIAPHNAVVHHNENGILDYWLLPRIISGAKSIIKVVPLMQTNMGIFVHCVDDGRDYIVTPSGDWLAASDSNQ